MRPGPAGLADQDESSGEGVVFVGFIGVSEGPDIGAGGLSDPFVIAVPALGSVVGGEEFQAIAIEDPEVEAGGRVKKAGLEEIIFSVVIGGKGVGYVDVIITFYKLDGLLCLCCAAGVGDGDGIGAVLGDGKKGTGGTVLPEVVKNAIGKGI